MRTSNGSALRQRGPRSDVAVLEQIERLQRPARPQVDREHQLGSHQLVPPGELVQADLIRLQRVPGEVEPGRPSLPGPDTVLPTVARDEVAAGIPDGGDPELAHQLEHIGTKAVRIRRLVPRFVDAVVNAPPEVLHERAEQAPVDGADDERGIDDDPGFRHQMPCASR
jgi:hypothetical protein